MSVLKNLTQRKMKHPINTKELLALITKNQLKIYVRISLDTGNHYLKHRTYVDNVSSVFPEMKSTYDGKCIELDLSQNLALRPKDEVQSEHFSGKQLILHCSIINPVNNHYHFHLSDDTNHDSIFVDHVIQDIIDKYKNKYSFGL